jgi:hypothetical protein
MIGRTRQLIGVLAALGVWAAAGPALGQGLYRPATPTLSPWFDLYNRNTGPLDNYHQFVRPEINLRSTLKQTDARLHLQGAGLQALGAEVAQGTQQQGVRPTGAASVFMNYSHYYPSQGAPAGLPGAARRPAGQGSMSQSYVNRAIQSAR